MAKVPIGLRGREKLKVLGFRSIGEWASHGGVKPIHAIVLFNCNTYGSSPPLYELVAITAVAKL